VSGPGRRRRWWQWLLVGVVLLVVIVVGGAAIFVKSQPSAAPLTLPSAAARPPAGSVDGTWDVAAGSVAGFRIRESALGFGNDVTGRTTAVTGTAIIAGGLNVRQAEQRSHAKKSSKGPKAPRDPNIADLESTVSNALGLKVHITHRVDKGEDKGEIKIAYSSLEQMDDLTRRLSKSG